MKCPVVSRRCFFSLESCSSEIQGKSLVFCPANKCAVPLCFLLSASASYCFGSQVNLTVGQDSKKCSSTLISCRALRMVLYVHRPKLETGIKTMYFHCLKRKNPFLSLVYFVKKY